MSDTPSDPPSSARHLQGPWIEWLLAGFCVAMLAAMWRFIDATTIPYHLLFLAVGLVYGFRVWPLRPTAVVLTLITLATGTIFLRAHRGGLIEIDEVTEIVLMPMLLVALIWHARRRESAVRQAQHMAAVNAELLEREHEGLRDTSHAIRTPTAIALGFVELAAATTDDEDILEPLSVVARHLRRTSVLSDRLLSLSSLEAEGIASRDMIQVGTIVERLALEWSQRGARVWQVESTPHAWVLGSASAFEGAIDALLENALHHTAPGDTVRVRCWHDADCVRVEVADSGPGIADDEAELVFQRFWHTTAPDGTVGSGLGLAMVEAVARAHEGSVSAGRSSLGGARFTICLPRQASPPSVTAPSKGKPAASPRSRVTSGPTAG